MAMAQFSYGQMEATKMRGEQLPVPGGYDEAGNISTDPGDISKSWRVLPIGFWKGSGMSILLDVIATVLSGGRSTFQVGKLGDDEYQLSQVCIAIDAKGIAGESFLASAVNEVVDDIKASVRVDPAQEVLYPGQKEQQTRAENMAQGIPVDDGVWAKIKAL
jgi:3-dehydro-L-gulonate 2-dehydrogenase